MANEPGGIEASEILGGGRSKGFKDRLQRVSEVLRSVLDRSNKWEREYEAERRPVKVEAAKVLIEAMGELSTAPNLRRVENEDGKGYFIAWEAPKETAGKGSGGWPEAIQMVVQRDNRTPDVWDLRLTGIDSSDEATRNGRYHMAEREIIWKLNTSGRPQEQRGRPPVDIQPTDSIIFQSGGTRKEPRMGDYLEGRNGTYSSDDGYPETLRDHFDRIMKPLRDATAAKVPA